MIGVLFVCLFCIGLQQLCIQPIYLLDDGMELEDCSIVAHNCLWIIPGPSLKYKAVLGQFGVYIGPHTCRSIHELPREQSGQALAIDAGCCLSWLVKYRFVRYM